MPTPAPTAKRSRNRINSTRCPVCGERCGTTRVEQITPLYREVIYSCRNEECGFTFVASITPVRTLVPPKIPNPQVMIPAIARGCMPAPAV
ncbi:ogr/Delta-like zinc finger family protein (plasmid) [Azospirillum melinis]|uniref:ogr/Delta-like zinc finger family protein n=1 Tax=Azospirillum melinis TaxID=328839 RepID=UPI0037577DE4